MLTFILRGGPELGQLGGVRPVGLRLQTKNWAICPWLHSSSGSRTPKNDDIMFIGAGEGVSNDDFDCIWINCTNARKCDVCGGVNDGGKDKVCGE